MGLLMDVFLLFDRAIKDRDPIRLVCLFGLRAASALQPTSRGGLSEAASGTVF